jgi:hypothetical protein
MTGKPHSHFGHGGCLVRVEPRAGDDPRSKSEELVMIRKFAQLALIAVVGGALWSLRQGSKRASNQPKVKHPAEQTWEGEGGALPATGSQMGPNPVLPVTTETY